MSHFLTKTMPALDRPAFQFDRFVQRTLHCKLSGFAFLICRSAKVSIGYEIDDWFRIHEGFDFTECVLLLRCFESVALALHSLQAEHMTSTTSPIRWSPTTPLARIRVEELMDDPALDPREHHAALAGLKRLNAWSKSARILWPSIARLAVDINAQGRPLRVMDVATGSGDGPMAMAKLARRRGLNINWTLCDFSSRALEVAQQNAHVIGERVNLLRIDLLREEIPARADVVISSLFMHHLDHDTGQTVMRTMASAADVAVGIADLDRSNAGLALAWIGSRMLTRSRVVHFDAIASVRAAFTVDEARAMAHEAGLHGASVSRAWPARWRLWWQRPSARAASEVSL